MVWLHPPGSAATSMEQSPNEQDKLLVKLCCQPAFVRESAPSAVIHLSAATRSVFARTECHVLVFKYPSSTFPRLILVVGEIEPAGREGGKESRPRQASSPIAVGTQQQAFFAEESVDFLKARLEHRSLAIESDRTTATSW